MRRLHAGLDQLMYLMMSSPNLLSKVTKKNPHCYQIHKETKCKCHASRPIPFAREISHAQKIINGSNLCLYSRDLIELSSPFTA
jgi:hypothetical protein